MTELQALNEEQEDQVDYDQVGVIAVMNGTGDTKYSWHRDQPAEVEIARQTFQSFRDKGFAAFRVSRDGTKGEQIKEFDPRAETILFAPQMKGG